MGQPTVAPRLSGSPMGSIDDVECVGVAPLAAIGPAEVASVARRAPEIYGQERYSLLHDKLAEGHPVAESLRRGAAVRVNDARDPSRLVASAARWQVERPLDSEAVSGVERYPPAAREVGRVDDHGHRIGELARPDARCRFLRDWQQPQILGHAIVAADGDDTGRVGEPADGHPYALERVDHRRARTHQGVREGRVGVARGVRCRWFRDRDPGPDLGSDVPGLAASPSSTTASSPGTALRQLSNQQVHQAFSDFDVDEPTPIGRRHRRVSPTAARFAVLVLPGGEHRALRSVRGDANHLEPAALVGDHEQSAAVREPAGRGFPRRPAGNEPFRPGSHVDYVDLRSHEVRKPLRGHGEALAVGRPDELVDIYAGRRERDGLRRPRLCRRPTPAGHRRIHQPHLIPTPTARYEGDMVAVGGPAWRSIACRMLRNQRLVGPFDVDHPDGVFANEGDATSIGRPLRIGCGFLCCRQLLRIASTDRHQVDLRGAGSFRGIGDTPAIGGHAELPRRFDGRRLLDSQPIAKRPSAATVLLAQPGRVGHNSARSSTTKNSSLSPATGGGSTRTNVSVPNICSSWPRVSGSSHRRPRIWLS